MGRAVGVGAGHGWLDGRIAWRRALMALVVQLVAAPVVAVIASLLSPSGSLSFGRARPSPPRRSAGFTRCCDTRTPRGSRLARHAPSASLANRDLDLLLAWGLPVWLSDGRATARIDLESAHAATLSLSLRWPGGSRYLNLMAGARAAIDNERLTLGDPRCGSDGSLCPGRPCAGFPRSFAPSSRPSDGRGRSWPAWSASISTPGGSP